MTGGTGFGTEQRGQRSERTCHGVSALTPVGVVAGRDAAGSNSVAPTPTADSANSGRRESAGDSVGSVAPFRDPWSPLPLPPSSPMLLKQNA